MNAKFWQPTLTGPRCLLRPLQSEDFDALFKIASDPTLWEQHPVHDRYKEHRFRSFFQEGLNSGGALAIVLNSTGELVGSSRFNDFQESTSSVEIGYTFLAKNHWGTGLNAEVKHLMISHALTRVEKIFFYVGEGNIRSQRALSKLGIKMLKEPRQVDFEGRIVRSFVYLVERET